MSNRIEKISQLLLEEIESRFDKEPLSIDNLEFSESFSEIICNNSTAVRAEFGLNCRCKSGSCFLAQWRRI